jgi:hypothetical protein
MKKPTSQTFQFKIGVKNGKKVVELLSRDYYEYFLKKKTKEGELGTLELKFKKPTRSESQLRYYWVLVGMIAEHTGYTDDEVHDALMKLKWGTKRVKIGNNVAEVRKSISNSARFSKVDMIEHIEFTLEKCNELDIYVPSREELGYLPK